MLTERAMALKKMLGAKSKRQMELLLEQQDKLRKFRASVQNGMQSQNKMVLNQDTQRKKRECNLREITSNVLGNMAQETKPPDIRDIVFRKDDQAVSEVCRCFIFISFVM